MAASPDYRLLIHSAKQVVQVVKDGRRVLSGSAMKEVATLGGGSGQDGFSAVVDTSGRIAAVGTDEEIREQYAGAVYERVIDARGQVVMPGFVDAHTHAVWAGDRVHEFAMKLAGASYMEVHEAGGGINFTVDHVRRASEDELYAVVKSNALRMVQSGTTLAEIKSGYGLDADNEVKMLRVINRLIEDEDVPLDVSVTYCGAHSVPTGLNAEQATSDVITRQIPRINALRESGELRVDNIDVFCEKGVFNVDQTRRILQAGLDIGLNINFHGEELSCLNSAEMGAELGSLAISHLEEVSDAGMVAMAEAGTLGVLLPTTAYILRLTPPPARTMLDCGMALALGSDLNPNAHCLAMPVVLHLACVLLRLSMNEALVAATINAAAALGRADSCGSVEVGKNGDLLVLDTPTWEHVIYQLGGHNHVIKYVIKHGKVVHSNQRPQ